jgi:axin 1
MQVDRFLSDSGGNFTESAPRPPVPGEENELQSNGGTSTRSSSSHKSQLSSKSHTSSGKSGRSENHHSPAATPRRSNLDKSHLLASHDVVSCKEDMEAPLGFEPEGSAASSPPFNENSPPPYLKWAENIESLFEDLDGVRLFKKFLDQESSSNPLDFWFACKGLQEGVQSDNEEKIQSLVKLIYKRYIRGDHLQLPTDMKKSITTKFKKQIFNQGIFKEAQMLVQSRMSNDTYPLFLKSDIYVQYVQQGGESPKTISNTSSGSNSARPLSGPLPTVHEGEELRQEDLKAVATTIVGAHSGSSVSTANTTILPLTSEALNATYSVRGAASTKFAIPEGYVIMEISHIHIMYTETQLC